MMFFSIFALICCTIPITYGSNCPHEDTSLKKWSEAASWPNNKVPVRGDKVTVTGDILLDVSPPDLSALIIDAGGKLVWSPATYLHLRTDYILINGEFHMGSESCQFDNKARITLTGRRSQYKIANFNEKFLGVAAGGTLEIHGKKKLSWTKVTKTVRKTTMADGVLLSHYNKLFLRHYEGLIMYVLNEDGTVYSKAVYYTSGQDKDKTDRDIDLLNNYPADVYDSIPDGKIFLMAVQDSLVGDPLTRNMSGVFDTIELIGGIPSGKSAVRDIAYKGAYVMAAVKGSPSLTKEEMVPPNYFQNLARVSITKGDLVFTAESMILSKAGYRRWANTADIRVSSITTAQPIIEVFDDVSSWVEGDKVLLTSTDYDWIQAEIARVLVCPKCTNKQVKLAFEPKYMHFAEMISNVDLRGEIALLTRNIVIEGEMQPKCPPENKNCKAYPFDTFGGHVKALKGFKDVHIEGAELVHMGQQTDKGHYPLHFHMCEDVDSSDYPNPPYLRDNTIHRSYARCVTVHGTHGVKVVDNVAYDAIGHCYFLEDGGEKRTVFDGNLGAGVRKGTMLPTDRMATVFWITNPLTTFINNVAAGAEYAGVWIIYPNTPLGPSADKDFMQTYEARNTAFTEFDNNAIHSCGGPGLFIDNHLNSDDTFGGGNRHHPQVNPLDFSNDAEGKEIVISRVTSFKCRKQNVWLRGGWYRVTRASLADSPKGITMARSTMQEQFLEKSVILGESPNIGEPTVVYNNDRTKTYYPRSLASKHHPNQPFQGFIFYDGPVYVSDTFFDRFITDDIRPAGALGFKRDNFFGSSPVSGVRNLHFGFTDGDLSGNRVFDGNSSVYGFTDYDGDKASIFRDYEGSVTGIPNAAVVKDSPYMTTSDCLRRENWGDVAVCPHNYIKLLPRIRSRVDAASVPFAVRDDIPDDPFVITGERGNLQLPMIAGGEYSFTVHWKNKIPSSLELRFQGLEKDNPIRVGFCLPLDATFNLKQFTPIRATTLAYWKVANNISEIDADTKGGMYYHDKDSGIVYIKFFSNTVRAANDTVNCPDLCTTLYMDITSKNREDADCTGRYTPVPPASSNDIARRQSKANSLDLSTVYAEPEQDWGAGPMLPFTSRLTVDGQYGPWKAWSQCTAMCGGGTRFRVRACDSPIPRNGGADCVGPKTETSACNTHNCAIDGGFTQWSQWSATCQGITDSQCQGYQTRSRTCTSPAPDYGGAFCEGSTTEMRKCPTSSCA